ncbi:MAG: TonB-dependent receptor, partial [Luminiphilus sp.]
MKANFQKTLIAAVVAGASTASGVVNAQLEEVIVTAERREANIQDTPISMQALTADQIEKRGIMSLGDLFISAAGVSGYEAPSSRGNMSLNIRGVGSGNSNSPSTDPAIGLYVDGVFIGKGISNGVDAIDLERIEILRGPQGTLYGRNSTGGAVNLVTKKPSSEGGVEFQASVGDYGYRSVKGRIDFPVGDNLAISGSMYKRERDDLYENTNELRNGFENIDRDGFRLAARWMPTDRVTIDYAFANDKLDERSQMLNIVGLNPMDGYVPFEPGYPDNLTILSSNRPDTVDQLTGGLAMAIQYGLYPSFGEPVDSMIGQFLGWGAGYSAWANERLANYDSRTAKGSSDTDSYNVSDVEHHNLTLNWEMSDAFAVKAIVGYRDTVNELSADLDGMDNSANGGVIGDLPLLTIGGLLFNQVVPDDIPRGPVNLGLGAADEFALALHVIGAINEYGGAPIFNNYAKTDYEQTSFELQFSGSLNNLDYVVGLFHWEDEAEFRNHRIASFPLATSDTSSYDIDTEATSVFGEVTWRAGNLALTGGLRYTEEDKDVTYLWRGFNSDFINRYYTHLFSGGNMSNYNLLNNYVTNEQAETLPERAGIYGREFSESFSNVSGRATAQYFFSDDLNVYATYATGYRSGGFNGDFFDSANDYADAYDEEEVTSYEIGMKSSLMGGRMQFNAAAFMYEYEDLQVSTVLAQGNTVTSAIGNAGEAEREGLEMSLALLVTDNLLATVNYTHIDGDFDRYPGVTTPNNDLALEARAKRGMCPDVQGSFSVDWQCLQRG